MNLAVAVVATIFGLIIGSFLNVVIYRIPRRESIVLPASHCPACNHSLAIRDNIPVISFLLARGKCRYCGDRISIQYPLVEAVSAGIMLGVFLDLGLTPKFPVVAAFFLLLMTVSVIDIQHKIIPNVIIIPAIVLAVLLLPLQEITKTPLVPLIDQPNWIYSAAGFIIGGGFLFLLAILWPNGMGGGDIKLAAFMGLFLGRYIAVSLFMGFLLGSIAGLVSMTFLGKNRKDLIPFGPYLAIGAVVTLYFGVPLVKWYISISGLG